MRTLGFTGTRDVQLRKATSVLITRQKRFEAYDEYVTGACKGWDAFAGEILLVMFPSAIHRVIVPADRSQVEYWWEKPAIADFIRVLPESGGHFFITEMPDGSTYKDRNQAIVNKSDSLFYCASHPEDHGRSTRSGTWQTVRLARAKKIHVYGVVLNEE